MKNLFLLLALCCQGLYLQAQQIEVYWENKKLDPAKSLEGQGLYEEDELRVQVQADASLRKKYPQAESVQIVRMKAIHIKDQQPIKGLDVSDAARIPLKNFRIIKGEKLLLSVERVFVIMADGRKELYQPEKCTLSLTF
jgi:hypothetical protein